MAEFKTHKMSSLHFDVKAITEICHQNDVSMLGLFGSFARGEATAQSDVDLLIEFSKPKSLLTLIRLERLLTAIIGKKVDLLTKASISPYLRERILQEVEVIYDSR
jgi:uncharacterized protein